MPDESTQEPIDNEPLKDPISDALPPPAESTPKFFDYGVLENLDYDALPPLVPKGADRDEILARVVEGWCMSHGKLGDFNAHLAAGGFMLDRVHLWDANTETPIDLGELLRAVEDRLRANGAPEKFGSRPDLYVLLRGCRVDLCNAPGLNIRPRFAAFGVRFGDSASFRSAKFGDSTSFRSAKFGDAASFDEAEFGDSADFHWAEFGDSASFRRATFGDSPISYEATFGDSASFGGATFGDSARFDRATFGDSANFISAKFGDSASFNGAKFGDSANYVQIRFGPKASFIFTDFNKGKLFDAELPEADLRQSLNYVLDATMVRGARFAPRARDPWSRLRRAYTGPKLIFNLLFLTLFFIPYAAKTAYWVGVNRAEQRIDETITSLRERVDGLRGEHPAEATALEQTVDALHDKLPGPGNPNARQSRVWKLVIGADKGVTFWATALLLIVYNLLRGFLTAIVAPMRDEEERSGHTPRYRADSWSLTAFLESYRWLIWPHRVATGLFWLAVVSFGYNAWDWLSLPVYLPPVD